MADEPDNLILQMLRDIRSNQDALAERMSTLEARVDDGFGTLGKRVEDMGHEITYALGMIVNADRKSHRAMQDGDELKKRLDETIARLEALEPR